MMNQILSIGQAVIERGLLFSIIVAGMYITSRMIKFDDLTIEGSFGLGGAVTAFGLLNGLTIWLTIPLVLLTGALTGLATGLLFTKLKLNNLIAGIVVATALFSINLKLAGANVVLSGQQTLFDLASAAGPLKFIVILLPICLLVIYGIVWFLKTQHGFLLRASGCNAQVLTNLGKNINAYKIVALALSNMCAALTGSLFVQYTGYYSVWASVGIVIISLAGLILAEIFSVHFGIAILFGSIAYQAIIAATFEVSIDQDWNKLITALLIIGLTLLKKHNKIVSVRG